MSDFPNSVRRALRGLFVGALFAIYACNGGCPGGGSPTVPEYACPDAGAGPVVPPDIMGTTFPCDPANNSYSNPATKGGTGYTNPDCQSPPLLPFTQICNNMTLPQQWCLPSKICYFFPNEQKGTTCVCSPYSIVPCDPSPAVDAGTDVSTPLGLAQCNADGMGIGPCQAVNNPVLIEYSFDYDGDKWCNLTGAISSKTWCPAPDADGGSSAYPGWIPRSMCNSAPAVAPYPGTMWTANDCNDGDSAVYPGAPEVCNGIDDNCNGLIDENDAGAAWGMQSCDPWQQVSAGTPSTPPQCAYTSPELPYDPSQGPLVAPPVPSALPVASYHLVLSLFSTGVCPPSTTMVAYAVQCVSGDGITIDPACSTHDLTYGDFAEGADVTFGVNAKDTVFISPNPLPLPYVGCSRLIKAHFESSMNVPSHCP